MAIGIAYICLQVVTRVTRSDTAAPGRIGAHTQARDARLQFGVNVIIFSLIQEGSATRGVMDTVGD